MSVRIKEAYGPVHACGLSGTVIRGKIESLVVPEHFRARIYRGASLGVRDRTPLFHAGEYSDAWLYGKWLHDDRPKFVEVTATDFRRGELLECRWRERARNSHWKTGIQRFEPGEFEDTRGDFKNDVFETVIVPQDATATLYDGRGHSRRFVEFKSPGRFDLDANDLSHRVSSLTFKRDDWKEIGQRLGEVRARREIGKPITLPFKATGLPGAVLHPFVNLGRTRDTETNWHVDQRVGVSATIGTGEASPVKAELTVSAETETGGGGGETKGYTEGTGISVDAAADDDGILEGFILAQLLEGTQQVFRTLENLRTGAKTQQEGEITGQLYSYEVHFEHGKGVV